MVCSPVPALMIWQVTPVRNSPRQFSKKAEIRRHKPPVRTKAHHAAVIMAGKRQIGSI